jgi:hypothetical protein
MSSGIAVSGSPSKPCLEVELFLAGKVATRRWFARPVGQVAKRRQTRYRSHLLSAKCAVVRKAQIIMLQKALGAGSLPPKPVGGRPGGR